jgi:hypothetical protein
MAVEDPVATLFGRYFTVRTDKRKIDHSWSVGELEHLQRDAVIEYLQMPERVKNIEGRMATIDGNIAKVTDILGKLVNLQEGLDSRGVAEGHRSMKDYVS